MKAVYAKHEPYKDGHLEEVLRDMEVAGPPTIRVVERRGETGSYYALEGSHRLALAFALGLTPKLVVVEPDAGEELGAFWDRVAPTLPRYDFGHAYVLELSRFNFPEET